MAKIADACSGKNSQGIAPRIGGIGAAQTELTSNKTEISSRSVVDRFSLRPMHDYRSFSRKVKRLFKSAAFQILEAAGRYRRIASAERATKQSDGVKFFGERPGQKGPMTVSIEHRLIFKNPPPSHEDCTDIYYSADGNAWVDGKLYERYSIEPPSLLQALTKPDPAAPRIPRGAILEGDLYGYGAYADWQQGYLGTLLTAGPLDEVVLIPLVFGKHDYVRRDLDRLGVNYRIVEDWVRVDSARILRKRNPLLYWGPAEVTAFQNVFAANRQEPVPGSVTYFGRFAEAGTTPQRVYPSEMVADVISSRGGRVVRQDNKFSDRAPQLGEFAETAIIDHGSGSNNIMHWRAKNLIELYVNDWWANNALFVAHYAGVQNLAVINVDGIDRKTFEAKLDASFAFFASADKGAA